MQFLHINNDITDKNKDHLAEGWLVVQSGAAVSMSACSNFEIEGTIDPERNTP